MKGEEVRFWSGTSPSVAVLFLSGCIPSHSSCYVYTCTYSVVNSLLCCSVTIFEDNHLVENLLQGWSSNPENSAALRQLWGETPNCEKSSMMNLKCWCSLVQDSSGKQFSKWELRDALERNLLWRWTAHLLMESFRQAASVCKSLSCNTFVGVAFSLEA